MSQGLHEPGTKPRRGKLCSEPAGHNDIETDLFEQNHRIAEASSLTAPRAVRPAQPRRGLVGRISIRVVIVRGGDLSR